MLKEFVNRILELQVPSVETVDGRNYSTRAINLITPPAAKPIIVNTLTGFVGFIKSNIDKIDHKKYFIHVESHKTVSLMSSMDPYKRRHSLVTACHKTLSQFDNDRYIDKEKFLIDLQTYFKPNDDRAKLLAVVGKMKAEKITEANDDGITQTVAQRAGVSLVSEVDCPNPVTLIPYRTFFEIEQPSSQYIFRVKQRNEDRVPDSALFIVENGSWECEAVESIRKYLDGQKLGIPVFA